MDNEILFSAGTIFVCHPSPPPAQEKSAHTHTLSLSLSRSRSTEHARVTRVRATSSICLAVPRHSALYVRLAFLLSPIAERWTQVVLRSERSDSTLPGRQLWVLPYVSASAHASSHVCQPGTGSLWRLVYRPNDGELTEIGFAKRNRSRMGQLLPTR